MGFMVSRGVQSAVHNWLGNGLRVNRRAQFVMRSRVSES